MRKTEEEKIKNEKLNCHVEGVESFMKHSLLKLINKMDILSWHLYFSPKL